MMSPAGRTYINQSVSFPPALLSEAKARAERLNLSFSAYVQKCVERDLSERGAIVYVERPTKPLVAAEGPSGASSPGARKGRSRSTRSRPKKASAN